ncbi:MAG: polymer-forming cytoskeletal protein [Pseudomonadota bacterium]
MFSRSKKPPSTGTPPPAPTPSILSSDMRVVGDISSQGEIQIDGTVEGDIRAKSVLVGESADIKGEIFSEQVHIHGRVNGLIKSSVVHLARTAHVVGDVLHESMSIETGAFIEGNCKHMSEPRGVSAQPSAAQALPSPLARVIGKDVSAEVKKHSG